MIETERVAEKMDRAVGFRELVFSQNEINYCEAKKINSSITPRGLQLKKHFIKQ